MSENALYEAETLGSRSSRTVGKAKWGGGIACNRPGWTRPRETAGLAEISGKIGHIKEERNTMRMECFN